MAPRDAEPSNKSVVREHSVQQQYWSNGNLESRYSPTKSTDHDGCRRGTPRFENGERAAPGWPTQAKTWLEWGTGRFPSNSVLLVITCKHGTTDHFGKHKRA